MAGWVKGWVPLKKGAWSPLTNYDIYILKEEGSLYQSLITIIFFHLKKLLFSKENSTWLCWLARLPAFSKCLIYLTLCESFSTIFWSDKLLMQNGIQIICSVHAHNGWFCDCFVSKGILSAQERKSFETIDLDLFLS